MERFTALVMNAKDYNGDTSETALQRDREEILALAAQNPDLVDKFFDAVDSNPEWKALAENGVQYYIMRIKDLKSSHAREHTDPSICPMIWSSGQVAAIKVTKWRHIESSNRKGETSRFAFSNFYFLYTI